MNAFESLLCLISNCLLCVAVCSLILVHILALMANGGIAAEATLGAHCAAEPYIVPLALLARR